MILKHLYLIISTGQCSVQDCKGYLISSRISRLFRNQISVTGLSSIRYAASKSVSSKTLLMSVHLFRKVCANLTQKISVPHGHSTCRHQKVALAQCCAYALRQRGQVILGDAQIFHWKSLQCNKYGQIQSRIYLKYKYTV